MFRRNGPSMEREYTTMYTVGCETCPNRRELCVPGVGKVAVQAGLTPFEMIVGVTTTVKERGRVTESAATVTELSINSKACSGPDACDMADNIRTIHESLASEPAFLNAQVDVFDEPEEPDALAN